MNTSHCAACHGSCPTCDGPLNSHCTSCLVPLNVQPRPTRTCAAGCPPGFTADEFRVCAGCHPNCADCTDSLINSCTSCFSDRHLRPDKVCAKNCLDGFFYEDLPDNCAKCHPICETCTAGSASDCILCAHGMYKQPDGLCEENCPFHYYKDPATMTCKQCKSSCGNCDGPSDKNCLSCVAPSVLLSTKQCAESCPPFHYTDPDQVCMPCHSSCLTCLGGLDTNCLTCKGDDTVAISTEGKCINCLTDRDQDKDLCSFVVQLTLASVGATSAANPKASATLQVSHQGMSKFFNRLTQLPLRDTYIFNIKNVD